MKFFKYLLLPIQVTYSLVILIRNHIYNYKIIRPHHSDLTTISVGNIKNGGTGKTPMTEYLIELFKDKNIAILSRGYKRKTKGFILAKKGVSAKEIGDENCQLYHKYKNITVACDENRVNGVKKIKELKKDIKLIILDDAFQHRRLARDLDIVLTEYDNLFFNDQLMPIGKLREHKKEIQRAHIIIVTKCPVDLTLEKKISIIEQIKPPIDQKIYFSYIKEYKFINKDLSQTWDIDTTSNHLLITGIANAKPLVKFLNDNQITYHHLEFQDHYQLQQNDILQIIKLKKIKKLSQNLLLTEKDYYRLSVNQKRQLLEAFNLICIQIKIDFIEPDKSNFNNQLIKFGKSKKI